MKMRRRAAALILTASMLLSGCGSLFLNGDTTVSLSSQGTEGVDEMLSQGMEIMPEIYEEDRWSGEITSTARAFYIDPLANETMISFELINHDESSHVLLYAYQALKKDPDKVAAYDAYYEYVRKNRDASEAYTAARDLYDRCSSEESAANTAFQEVLTRLSLAEQAYLGLRDELAQANESYAQGKISMTELTETQQRYDRALAQYEACSRQKTEAGTVLAQAQSAREEARRELETAVTAYEAARKELADAEQSYRNAVGTSSAGFREADMDTDDNTDSAAAASSAQPAGPSRLSTGTDGQPKTLLEAVTEQNSAGTLLYREEGSTAAELLMKQESASGASLTRLADSYIPGTVSAPIMADDAKDGDYAEALEELEEQQSKIEIEDKQYDSTQGVNGGDELLQDPQAMICEVVMYDYQNKRFSSIFKTEAEPSEEKMLYVNLLGDRQVAVFYRGEMMFFVQDSSTGGYSQLWHYDMSSYYEPQIAAYVPNLDEWSVENVLSLSGGQENYLLIRATEKESEAAADDDDAAAEELENRTHYLLVRLMADTLYDTGNCFLQLDGGEVYYYGFLTPGESAVTGGYSRSKWWSGDFIIRNVQDIILQRGSTALRALDITSASNWGDDTLLKSLYSQKPSVSSQEHMRVVRNAIVTSTTPLCFNSNVRARSALADYYYTVESLGELSGYLIGGKYYYESDKMLGRVENGTQLLAAGQLLGSEVLVAPLTKTYLDDLEGDSISKDSRTIQQLQSSAQLPMSSISPVHMSSGFANASQQPEIRYFPLSEGHVLERGSYQELVQRLSAMSDAEKALLYSIYAFAYYPAAVGFSEAYDTLYSGGTLSTPEADQALRFLELLSQYEYNPSALITAAADWISDSEWNRYFGFGDAYGFNLLNGAAIAQGDYAMLSSTAYTALSNYAALMQQSSGTYAFRQYGYTFNLHSFKLEVGEKGDSGYSIAVGMDVVNAWIASLNTALMNDSEWSQLKIWPIRNGSLFQSEIVPISAMAGTTLAGARVMEDDYIMLPLDNKSLATMDYQVLCANNGSLLSAAQSDFTRCSSGVGVLFAGIGAHNGSFDAADNAQAIVHDYADEREFVDATWEENGERILNFMLGKEYLRINRRDDGTYTYAPRIFTQFADLGVKEYHQARLPIAELEVGVRCGEEEAGSMASTPGAASTANPSAFGGSSGTSQLIPNAWSLQMLREDLTWEYQDNGEQKSAPAFSMLIAGQSYGLIRAEAPWDSYTDQALLDQVKAEQLLPGCYYILLPSEQEDTFYLIGYDDVTKTYRPSDIAGAGIFKITISETDE